MGAGTWACFVDLDRFRSVVGSKDAALLAAIEERNAERLRQVIRRADQGPIIFEMNQVSLCPFVILLVSLPR